MATVYRVTFTDLTGRIVNYSSNYDSLYDALDVAKNTDISDSRITRKMLTDEQFNSGLFQLLTQGYLHTGIKTQKYPQGIHVIYLTKVTDTLMTPVYSEEFTIPQQTNGPFVVEYMTSSSATKRLTFHHKGKAIEFIESCGVENTYMVTEFNFDYKPKSNKEEVSK